MRVYLDCCCLQRPHDDQTQPRIKVETEAILAILASVQAGDIILLSSEALDYEIRRIPDEERRREVFAVLELASEYLEVTEETEELAESIETRGIFPMDAVHLALASITTADFFCTCDDRLVYNGRTISCLNCKVVSVLDLASEVLL